MWQNGYKMCTYGFPHYWTEPIRNPLLRSSSGFHSIISLTVRWLSKFPAGYLSIVFTPVLITYWPPFAPVIQFYYFVISLAYTNITPIWELKHTVIFIVVVYSNHKPMHLTPALSLWRQLCPSSRRGQSNSDCSSPIHFTSSSQYFQSPRYPDVNLPLRVAVAPAGTNLIMLICDYFKHSSCETGKGIVKCRHNNMQRCLIAHFTSYTMGWLSLFLQAIQFSWLN